MTDYITILINAICTGIGTSIGSYLGAKYAITHVQRIEEKVKQATKRTNGALRSND